MLGGNICDVCGGEVMSNQQLGLNAEQLNSEHEESHSVILKAHVATDIQYAKDKYIFRTFPYCDFMDGAQTFPQETRV